MLRFITLILLGSFFSTAAAIPLPEHPRPDFERPLWINLNGTWEFEFDQGGGKSDELSSSDRPLDSTITVPFGWRSPLSCQPKGADVAWYARNLTIPAGWNGRRVFLIIGASDRETTAWIDGKSLGIHRGGYTPFEFDLTAILEPGTAHRIVLRVDDSPRPFALVGKQGYGNARGIWQTVYIEARPQTWLESVHFLPDLENHKVRVNIRTNQPITANTLVTVRLLNVPHEPVVAKLVANTSETTFDVPIPNPRLWSLEDPFLHEATVTLGDGPAADAVNTHFGMRRIHVMNLPGTDHPWIALNGKPIYLQMALDQCHHPDGFYTFETDAQLRNELVLTRRLGMNSTRFHVKVEAPRKLYWADRLGLLVMADVPHNNIGPSPEMRAEWEHAWRGMIQRDFNHPSIFSWILFNETWGLLSQQADGTKAYLPETQQWVKSKVLETRRMDPTRLVEDNSQYRKDHVETDINSFHRYLPGYAWRDCLNELTEKNFPGSKDQFIGGHAMGRNVPLINSECGNVWGYAGSTGDVEWTWDYHCMMNEFRRFPEIGGWCYTQLHDVTNEWNGYYRYDRSNKITGLDELMPGMRPNDFHSLLYISTGQEICRDARPGETVEVPLFASFLTDSINAPLSLVHQLCGWDSLGRRVETPTVTTSVPFEPWLAKEIAPITLRMPDQSGLYLLRLTLTDAAGQPVHRNFCAFRVNTGQTPRNEARNDGRRSLQILRIAPSAFSHAEWSLKQWNVLDGLKVNGTGHGHFEYRIPWPKDVDATSLEGASFLCEASAKRLLTKDVKASGVEEQVVVQGGAGSSSTSPNSYPMSDHVRDPSLLRVVVNGRPLGLFDLDDDPADHRGILSWHAQPRAAKQPERLLHETGSYGYLIQATLTPEAIKSAAAAGEFIIRLEVPAALPGGLAIYGERFGRYPLDPTLVLIRKP